MQEVKRYKRRSLGFHLMCYSTNDGDMIHKMKITHLLGVLKIVKGY